MSGVRVGEAKAAVALARLPLGSWLQGIQPPGRKLREFWGPQGFETPKPLASFCLKGSALRLKDVSDRCCQPRRR